MKTNKLKIFLLSGSVLLVFLILVIIVVFSNSISSKNGPLPVITPYPTPDLSAEKRLLNILEHPPVLSNNDSAVKIKILAPLNGQAGDIYHGPDVIISYLPAGNEFQGEILTTNIELAKKEAVDWLEKQGLSQEGICNLPIMFFLSADTAIHFQNQDVLSSPLPPGC
jgi:hypothetical protein